jgi:hypothetical protein
MNAKRLRAAYYARYSTDGQEADSCDGRPFAVAVVFSGLSLPCQYVEARIENRGLSSAWS